MSKLSDKYYSKEELLTIAKKKQIPEKYYEDFIAFVENDIKKMTDDAELDEHEIGEAAIDFAKEYFDKYEIEIQKGHSREWAQEYAGSIEEHPHAFNNAYTVIKKNNPGKANEELQIHCKAIGGDDLYTKHFIYLIENGGDISKFDEQALSYSTIYKEQIVLGKSEIFAHQYADLMADGEDGERYCFWYAKSFDKCMQNGKSERYALLYSDKIGHYYSDYNSRYVEDEEIDAENHEFNERKILGYMNGWEYALQNNLDHADKFIEYYDNIYINTYYADDRDNSFNGDELDADILRRVLEQYNSFKNRQTDK